MGDYEGTKTTKGGETVSNHDPHYEPVITLPLQDIETLEEDEDEIFKMRAKLFRWAPECDPPEWKERGTGDLKFLQHKDTKKIRLLMRRDKTLKICANHFVEEYMQLSAHGGSERAWVWNVLADFADEEPKQEFLAVRFYNVESSKKFKEMFDKVRKMNKGELSEEKTEEDSEDAEEVEEENETKEEKEVESVAQNIENLAIDKTDPPSSNDVEEEESKKALTNGS